ncbi:MAG: ABC transporter ATP-binding protein/permease [Rhodothalassiaceae bacterium]
MPRGLPPSQAADAAKRPGLAILIRLLPWLWPAGRQDLRLRVLFSALLLIAAKLLIVATPFFYKNAIDALEREPGGPLLVPVFLIAAYGVARFLGTATAQLRDGLFARVSQHALRGLALTTFRHLHSLSLRFHLDRRTGGMSRAIERGTRAVDFILRFMLFNILPTLFELFLVAGIFLAHFGAPLALGLLAAVAVYVVFSIRITEWRTRFRRDMNAEDNKAGSRALDSLLNFETVKYFGNEEHEARRYDSALARYQDAAVKSQTSLSVLNIGQALIVNAALAGAMIVSAIGYGAGKLTLGDVVLANALLIQLFVPLNLLGFVYREIRQALIDITYLFDLLDRKPEIADRPGARPLALSGGHIRFSHVGFSYDPRRPILQDVDFEVPAGGRIAIVGPSGAGKSTISRILFRFYDLTEGAVTIDGQDIRDVTGESLRAAIGIVPQDTVLFNESIRYNIAYGAPEADEAAIREAARLARIDRFIEALPDGYDTLVGERGLKLSGGEKQRVAIARTILKNPRILLLDEATSALDSRTEAEIREALETVARGRTTIVIAHRLSTVRDADHILVMNHGRIVEEGTHDALMARDGLYAEMWARQRQGKDGVSETDDRETLTGAAKSANLVAEEPDSEAWDRE